VRVALDNLILSNAMRTSVMALTKSLSNELGSAGVLVNCVGPGRVATPRTDGLDDKRSAFAGMDRDSYRSQFCKQIPLSRYGTPEEVATLVHFLCSAENSYVTGQTILCDGGLTPSY
jgi:3-oxoacyl-[acyl-carrier protein] reductase